MTTATAGIKEIAVRLHNFARTYDEYEYQDQGINGVDFVLEIESDIVSGNTVPYREYLEAVLDEVYDEPLENEAVELINLLKNI